jgi:thiamine biosynthesis lipoprotein
MKIYNNTKSRFAGLFFVASFLSGCSTENSGDDKSTSEVNHKRIYTVINGKAQGTTYQIKYFHTSQLDLTHEIDSLLLAYDNSISTYNAASLITELNTTGTTLADSMFTELIDEARFVYRTTNGAFNPAIYPLISYWGFGNHGPEIVDSTEIDSLLKKISFDSLKVIYPPTGNKAKLSLPDGYAVEFNGIAPGHSVDLISAFLEKHNIENYMIEMGGEIKCRGLNEKGKIWKIGIDKPIEGSNEHQLYATLELKNASIATSGNYRKSVVIDGKRYSHTISPFSGYPAHHNLLSVTVLTTKCAHADGFATAFMVLGLEPLKDFLKKHPELEIQVFCIYSAEDGSLKTWHSPGINNYLSLVE